MPSKKQTKELKERVAVAFGGSILFPEKADPEFLRRAASTLDMLASQTRLLVVVGGGHPARQAIGVARKGGQTDERKLDRIGIAATRSNAQALISELRNLGANVNGEVPTTANNALRLSRKHDIVVMGGTEPGHSTDYVAVELAVKGRCARFVNATNVDGVFDKDPNKHPDAQFQRVLSFEEFLEIIGDLSWKAAGSPGVMDGPATKLLVERRILTCVVRGTGLDNFSRAVRNQFFYGTTIG